MHKQSIWFSAVLGLTLLLVFVAPLPCWAQSGSYSRLCGTSHPPLELAPGNWEGTLELTMTAQGGSAQLNIPLTFNMNGQLLLVASKGETDLLLSVSGSFAYTLSGQGAQGAGTEIKGSGDGLKLDLSGGVEQPRTNNFPVAATVSETQTLMIGGHQTARPASGGQMKMGFDLKRASCDTASGDFWADRVDQTAKSLAAGGYTLLTPLDTGHVHGTWQVKRDVNSSDEVEKLKRELNDAVSGHEQESQRLAKIGDRIKNGPPGLYPCLWQVYHDHVQQLFGQWVDEDRHKLFQYPGDNGAALDPLVKGALATSKALPLGGWDNCTANLQNELFQYIEGAYGKLIQWLVKNKQPASEVLNRLRQASLLGDVAPSAEKKAWDAIINDADNTRKDRAKTFKQLFTATQKNHAADLKAFAAANPSTPSSQIVACTPDLLEAWKVAVNAERIYTFCNTGHAPEDTILVFPYLMLQPPARCIAFGQ